MALRACVRSQGFVYSLNFLLPAFQVTSKESRHPIATSASILAGDESQRDFPTNISPPLPRPFNLDASEEDDDGALASAPPPETSQPAPVQVHTFRQPARLSDIPASIRPHFRVPSKKKHDPVRLDDIFTLAKRAAKGRYPESVDVSFKLTIDPRKSNQVVRGTTTLPHGTGKEKRVAVFATGADADAARDAGACLVGDEDLIQQIADKKGIDADVILATPDMMAKLGKVARILGPKGLMPNPKLGTVTTRVKDSVLELRRGKVQFRNDKGGVVSCSIGRISFDDELLKENFQQLLTGLLAVKPDAIKGNDISSYIQGAVVSSTTGKGFPLAHSDLSALGKAATAAINR